MHLRRIILSRVTCHA